MSGAPNYEPIEINAYFRSHTHLPLWGDSRQSGFLGAGLYQSQFLILRQLVGSGGGAI